PQELVEVAGAREGDDSPQEHREVQEGHPADGRAEAQVEARPEQGDRQDQHEQRLVGARVGVVLWIRADAREEHQRPIGRAADAAFVAHSGDGIPTAADAAARLAGVEASTDSYVETLARLSLFADLSHAQLEVLAHSFEEEVFAEGQRVVRQDVSGGSFYVILAGEAKVVIDGRERARLGRGDFFGEISILTDAPPTADVIAASVLRCLIIPDNELKAFLLEQPSVAYRMLQIEARRLRAANVWHG